MWSPFTNYVASSAVSAWAVVCSWSQLKAPWKNFPGWNAFLRIISWKKKLYSCLKELQITLRNVKFNWFYKMHHGHISLSLLLSEAGSQLPGNPCHSNTQISAYACTHAYTYAYMKHATWVKSLNRDVILCTVHRGQELYQISFILCPNIKFIYFILFRWCVWQVLSTLLLDWRNYNNSDTSSSIQKIDCK